MCHNFILIINFSSEHFKDHKGIAPTSTLRSAEVSSQMAEDHFIKKNSVFPQNKILQGESGSWK